MSSVDVQWTRHDFLLALNNFRSWDITLSLHTHPYHTLSSRWNWRNTSGSKSRWTSFGVCQSAQNIGLSNRKLKSTL